MNIIFFSDKNYEYQIISLIKSLDFHAIPNLKFIYYTIGFDSNIDRINLEKRRIEINPAKPRFEFYKPEILHDSARKDQGHSIFLDSDILVGKRFNLDLLRNDFNFPMMSIGNWDTPIAFYSKDLGHPFPVFKLDDRIGLKGYRETGNICEIDFSFETYSIRNEKGVFLNIKQSDVEPITIVDHTRLKDYLNIPNQTMGYVSSCLISFNPTCADFFLEWKSWCENEYLLSKRSYYFPFQDETAINVLLWKKGVTKNFGRIFFNTIYSDALIHVEQNEFIRKERVFQNPNQFCSDSSKVIFYHGLKDPDEITKALDFIESEFFLDP